MPASRSSSLMAIPFFIFAGDLMVRGSIAAGSSASPASMVGHFRGGLGQVNIAASVLFGGISGSAVADASAIGGLMIPQMKATGYGVEYAVNVTCLSALIALMIPPSHNMIIYSISGGGKISIADLFTAGIIPGLLLAIALMLAAWYVAKKRNYPTVPLRRLGEYRLDGAQRHSRHHADRHHLRRRALRHLHRHGKLLHRHRLRGAGDGLRLSLDGLAGFRRRDARRGAHHGHGAADRRLGGRLRLAARLSAHARADDRGDPVAHRQSATSSSCCSTC